MNEKAKEALNKAANICLFVKENRGDEQTARYMAEAIEAINEAVSSSNAHGDVAALRKALEYVKEMFYVDCNGEVHICANEVDRILNNIDTALAAPARNVGRFDEYHDAIDAWHREERCLRRHMDGGTCEKDPLAPTLSPVCFARWLFALAEGKEADNG